MFMIQTFPRSCSGKDRALKKDHDEDFNRVFPMVYGAGFSSPMTNNFSWYMEQNVCLHCVSNVRRGGAQKILRFVEMKPF